MFPSHVHFPTNCHEKKLLSFSSSTQTHILELIKELGLETYPQYTIGKKVHHMGGPDAKIRTYSSSIPALSPLVLMDLTQLLWKVRQQIGTECLIQDYVQREQRISKIKKTTLSGHVIVTNQRSCFIFSY